MPGGDSLTRFLIRHRGIRSERYLQALDLSRILAWADDYRRRHGRWPSRSSGAVADSDGDTWQGIDDALRVGLRGLPGGSSLAKLLEQERHASNVRHLPDLNIPHILQWAYAHRAVHGCWPTRRSGAIPGNEVDTWATIATALYRGIRGIPEPTSLARLLAKHRGRRTQLDASPHSVNQILEWADRWCEERGTWPGQSSGPIPNAQGETWRAVDWALHAGFRGLPGGDSLAGLLTRYRGVRSRAHRPKLELMQIRAWAEAYRAKHGKWPTGNSGPVEAAEGESWRAIDMALKGGRRGLPGGSPFPQETRRAIYTTNAIESVNSAIRKFTRNRRIYPNEESALKIIFMAIREASRKWTMPIRHWKQALNHFAILFEGRLPT